VDDAFPGAAIEIETRDGWFELAMRQHGLLRPLKAAELSDGTLRYLMLVAALLTPRPPELLALDEPEASLHPDLIPALARLIAAAAQRSQIVVVTHCRELADLLVSEPESRAIELTKDFGETRLAGEGFRPRWEWPKR
jgi:predicted ATPase